MNARYMYINRVSDCSNRLVEEPFYCQEVRMSFLKLFEHEVFSQHTAHYQIT